LEVVFVECIGDFTAHRHLHLVNSIIHLVHDRFLNLFKYSERFRFLGPFSVSRDEF